MDTEGIRKATPDDFDFAWRLYAEAVKPFITPLMDRPWVDEDEQRRFSTIWDAAKTSIISVGNERVGWIAVDDTAAKVMIENVCIAPSHRQRGIGGRVIEKIVTDSRAKGKPVELHVLKDTHSETWFSKLGFKTVGEEKIVKTMIATD